MASLQQFSVDALKLDRSFISSVAQHEGSASLIHGIVQLGETLGLDTIGEGIEESTQPQSHLREQCDSSHGYLLARPMTADALKQLIEAMPRLSMA